MNFEKKINFSKICLNYREVYMKKFMTFAMLLLSALACYGEILQSRFKITESEEEFDVIYYVTEDMKVIPNTDNEDVAVTQSFQLGNGEMRYSLFTDMGGADDTLQVDYAMWVFMCLSNIAGREVSGNEISGFKDSDVKAEFNGDFGCTTFIMNPASDYSKGYSYMMVEFFYKQKQGLVMRSFLFNDLNFVGITSDGKMNPDNIINRNYHTFKFMDN